MIKIRTLETLSFEEILNCFLKAFDAYYVKMPEDSDYYWRRWRASGVRYDLSFGAFNGDQLVGFIIHCIDERQGTLVAFNTGTGVIPEFRGQRIVSLIYRYALPKLLTIGISHCLLEVITKNRLALKIYKKTGFKVTRKYRCFQGTLNTRTTPAQMIKVNPTAIDWDQLPNQEYQSWDHQRNALLSGTYDFYQAHLENRPIGIVALNPTFKYMALIEITSGDQNHWGSILAGVQGLVPVIKINNVENRFVEKINALKAAGLKNTVDQFEMELELN